MYKFLTFLFFLPVFVFAQDSHQDLQTQSRNIASEFLQELGSEMKKQMQSGDPITAIDFCSRAAPDITSKYARRTGWQIKRVGTRTRNPMIGIPDDWEQDTLSAFADRKTDGEPLAGMDYAAIVTESSGRYFRYMKAIGVKPPCLTCHGDKTVMAEPLQEKLEKLYPHDAATGYTVGDLRGAVSIKIKLDQAMEK